MGGAATVVIPRKILEKAREEGVDVESLVIDLLASRLKLDPVEEAEAHLELAEKFFEEGVGLLERDPVQASEKLYKAVEECVKALAKYLRLEDVLARVRSRGRWTVTDLERAARAAAERVGEDIYVAWDRANYLRVWGFHEAKLDSESVRARVPCVEKAIKKVRELVRAGRAEAGAQARSQDQLRKH